MNAIARTRRDIERGFVLVGVLMFILILTILGLTLFSLSGFEAQFYTNSLDQKRAFYSATGAIERAKYVLSTTGKLDNARNITGVPLDGLMYTVAKQGTDFASADSSDTVQWANNPNPPKPVWIRSLAVVGGQRSMVEAQFTPHRGPSYYKRLFTLSDPLLGLTVIQFGPGGWSAAPQVRLFGGLWQNSVVPGWLLAGPPPLNPIDTSGGVTAPDVIGYWSKFSGAAIEEPRVPNDIYTLIADPTTHVGFWKSSFAKGYDFKNPKVWSLDGDPQVSNPKDAQIRISGTCIWMFDHGVRFNRHLVVSVAPGHVSDPDNDALIIVSRPGTDPLEFGRGIVFNQPLYSAQVPVYLVSDGGVGNENSEDPNASSSIAYLSVFAATCGLIGPQGAGHKMDLTHNSGASQDVNVTGLVDRLSRKGYLPNTSGSGDFTPIAGKWREITDSNPIN